MQADFSEVRCTFSHQGIEYTASGAYRVGDRALVYVGERQPDGSYPVTSWHGEPLGVAHLVSQWTRYGTQIGPYRMRAYWVRLNDGTQWHGRHNSDWACALKIRRCRHA